MFATPYQTSALPPQAKKVRGAILGKPKNLSVAAAASGRTARTMKADLFAGKVKPMILELMTGNGLSAPYGILS